MWDVELKQPRDGMDIWDIMDALFSMRVQLSQGAQRCRPKKLHLRSAHGATAHSVGWEGMECMGCPRSIWKEKPEVKQNKSKQSE